MRLDCKGVIARVFDLRTLYRSDAALVALVEELLPQLQGTSELLRTQLGSEYRRPPELRHRPWQEETALLGETVPSPWPTQRRERDPTLVGPAPWPAKLRPKSLQQLGLGRGRGQSRPATLRNAGTITSPGSLRTATTVFSPKSEGTLSARESWSVQASTRRSAWSREGWCGYSSRSRPDTGSLPPARREQTPVSHQFATTPWGQRMTRSVSVPQYTP